MQSHIFFSMKAFFLFLFLEEITLIFSRARTVLILQDETWAANTSNDGVFALNSQMISECIFACHFFITIFGRTSEVATLFLMKGSLLICHMFFTFNAVEFHFAEMIAFKSRKLDRLQWICITTCRTLGVSHSVPSKHTS